MKFTIEQLKKAKEIYYAWARDDQGDDLEFEDWIDKKIKSAKK